MTNERWRAGMPSDFIAVDDGSDEPLRCVGEATHLELITRANAELDAAEAREAALTKERDELRELLEKQKAIIRIQQSDLDTDAHRELARLRKLFDDAGQGEHNVLALLDFYMCRLTDSESELAARRARDEDVRECAWVASDETADPRAAEIARRLLACDWLKEGGS